MSWDLTITSDPESGREMGTLSQVRAAIERIFPEIEWTADERQGPSVIRGDGFLIEVSFTTVATMKRIQNLDTSQPMEEVAQKMVETYHESEEDSDEPVYAITMQLRGGGNPLEKIKELCQGHGWIATDDQDLTVIEWDAPPTKSLRRFQAFRKSLSDPTQNTDKSDHEG